MVNDNTIYNLYLFINEDGWYYSVDLNVMRIPISPSISLFRVQSKYWDKLYHFGEENEEYYEPSCMLNHERFIINREELATCILSTAEYIIDQMREQNKTAWTEEIICCDSTFDKIFAEIGMDSYAITNLFLNSGIVELRGA